MARQSCRSHPAFPQTIFDSWCLSNAQIGCYLERVIKAIGEISHANDQSQFHDLVLGEVFLQILESSLADRRGAPRHALRVQDHGFVLFIEQGTALVERERLN